MSLKFEMPGFSPGLSSLIRERFQIDRLGDVIGFWGVKEIFRLREFLNLANGTYSTIRESLQAISLTATFTRLQ